MDLSVASVSPSICLDSDDVKRIKQIEVNSATSSVVKLDDSNDAESIQNYNPQLSSEKQTNSLK